MMRYVGNYKEITATVVIIACLQNVSYGAAEVPITIPKELVSKAVAVWHMDKDKGDIVVDSKGKNNAKSYETQIVTGVSGKGKHFDGQNSYIETPLNTTMFRKGITISLWIKSEGCGVDTVCAILDSGHDEDNNFVLQSINKKADVFAWYANKNSVLFNVPHDKWTHLLLLMDVKHKIFKGYINGSEVKIKHNKKPFQLTDDGILTLGKLAGYDERYYKGAIDEVIVWDYALSYADVKKVLGSYNSLHK